MDDIIQSLLTILFIDPMTPLEQSYNIFYHAKNSVSTTLRLDINNLWITYHLKNMSIPIYSKNLEVLGNALAHVYELDSFKLFKESTQGDIVTLSFVNKKCSFNLPTAEGYIHKFFQFLKENHNFEVNDNNAIVWMQHQKLENELPEKDGHIGIKHKI
jgi:hypothetical protein